MVTHDAIMDRLRPILDPEMPISIVDLGLIEAVRIETENDKTCVAVDVLPTFVGCPALDMIRSDIERSLEAMDDVDSVDVTFLHAPPWSVDRITEVGRASLREHGVTVPQPGQDADKVTLQISAIPCPFCDSRSTRLESPFGPTRCRSVYYCPACKNTFEHMKRV